LVLRAASFRGVAALLALGAVVLGSGSGCGQSTVREPRVNVAGDAGAAGEAGEFATDGGAPSGAGAAFGGAPSAAGSSASGGAVAAAGAAGQPAAGEAGAPQATPSLTLRSISISQTHELPLMKDGLGVAAEDRPAPLVAGKRALVRAFVDLDAGFVTRPLLGVLDLKTPQRTRTLVSEVTLGQSSLQDDLTTTFVFNVDARDLSAASTYRVRVLEQDTTPIVRFPDTGYLELEAKTLPPFELVLVPFISAGFGPKVGAPEIAALRQRLLALYPSTDVEVTLLPPKTLGYVVNAAGDGWDNALDEIYQERLTAAPAHDVFYFGMLAPDDSYAAYCATDCILGLSNIADPDDVDSRGSIGITVFQDGSGTKEAWDTVAHELGHALGRDHAPCGLDDPDPDYPYPGGGMGGIYGYDFDLLKLIKPKQYRDVMSYCTPVWISDYTYRGIFERLDHIGHEAFRTLSFAPPELFRLARIRQTGESLWLGDRQRHGSATTRLIDLLDSGGQRVGSIAAQVTRLDHAPGGYVWLPARELGQSGAVSVDLRPLGGSVLPL
jgi:Peptidase M66